MLKASTINNNLAAAGPAKSVTINTPAKDDEKKEGESSVTGSTKQPTKSVHSKEAKQALKGGIPNAIVDLHISATEAQEQLFSRNGYSQVLQYIPSQNNVGKSGAGPHSTTFSNKTSIWIWQRHQGACSGRLKPVIDIILYSTGVSSDLVLAGYTCEPVPIAGQYVWIKRATTEEEENDAIVDLCVTSGRLKDASDPVWESPGVGWVRIDGNFTKSLFGSVDSFVWYLPARPRSMDKQMTHPGKGAAALTDEVRQTKLIAAVRLALRHYVPVEDVKRLAKLSLESNESTAQSIIVRSERMVDFSSVYHKYDATGKMNVSKWSKLLHDVGLRMKPNDITQCFNFFDSKHNGTISIEEFTHVLSLTDYEIDLALEKIRLKLLWSCVPKYLRDQFSQSSKNGSNAGIGSRTDIGVIGAQSIVQHPDIGKYKIRENFTLSQVFELLNVKADSILSLDEIMDLASKVEVFLTEEEARKIYALMDVDGDDRIEEADFISFMAKESAFVAKKAFRVRECAAMLRRWLVRGTAEKIDSNAAATASTQQWKVFKERYEKSTGLKFQGFLGARDFQLAIANLGVRISATEARELTLIVSAERSGKVQLAELHAFMGRRCRSFGELIALVRRELLTDLIGAYCEFQQAKKMTGKEDTELWNNYKKKLNSIKRTVESIYSKPKKDEGDEEPPSVDNDVTQIDDEEGDEGEVQRSQSLMQQATMNQQNDPLSRLRKSSFDVIAVKHLNTGLQEVFSSKKIPDNLLPNDEEWACLAILVDAHVAEGDMYGVRLKQFLEGLCSYIYSTDMEAQKKLGEKVELEIVSRELKLQIYREAKALSNKKRSKDPDYKSVFDLFDENKNGSISVDEFKKRLKRLQIVNFSDNRLDQILTLMDKGKHGSINFEDFRAFAQEAITEGLEDVDPDEIPQQKPKAKVEEIANDDDDDDDIDDMTLLLSDNGGAPPVAVTRSGHCDWLAWFLYRQAYRVEPLDPENVIVEFEDRCKESEIVNNTTLITAQEFWNILGEIKLRGKLTPEQFLTGIHFVCDNGEAKADGAKEAKPTDRVDYTAMCKYAIRMGRAFLAQVQEKNREIDKKFPSLLEELKKFFKTLCEESLKENNKVPKYEKIFRRLDANHDGFLTPYEFRTGLKQLRYKDVGLWKLRIIRRLFDECGKNKDELMSIDEFSSYILDRHVNDLKKPTLDIKEIVAVPDGKFDKLNASDDEDDEIFRKRHALTDFELIRKVNDILMDIVPPDSFNPDSLSQLEVVRSSVRRFFQRADPEFKGVVSEERFRAFLRRSGLQDSLTASELRRLTDKLKQRGTGKDRHEILIDYEKLCQQMLVASENIPKSKAETIFAKFQDACLQSNAAGRPFIGLCSLIDLRLTGKISKEELIHIGKMMDCEMTLVDLEAMLEIAPSAIVGKTTAGNINANSGAKIIDYRILNNVLQNFTPRDLDSRIPNFSMAQSMSTTGLLAHALPAYATPGATHIPTNTVDPMMLSKSINTPLGIAINSPMRRFDNGIGSPLPGGAVAASSSSAFEKIVKILIDRVRLAIDERSRSWNVNFSLRKKLETLDTLNSGLIGIRIFQMALDEIGVVLTGSEIQAVMSIYGRPDEDRIFYDSFCRSIEMQHNNKQDRDREASRESKDNAPKSTNDEPYLNGRVMQRLKELKIERRNPFDMFAVHDLDNTGLVTMSKFKEVITKLQLLQTEHQLNRAMENFSAIGNSSYRNSKPPNGEENELRLSMTTNTRRSSTGYVMDGDGFDGFRSSRSNINDDYPSGREDLREYYESLHRTANQNVTSYRNAAIELDAGSDGNYDDYALSPPKPSDSIAFARTRPLSPTRISRSTFDGFANTSINRPRTSPSKVGARIWGSDTPLTDKGRPLRGDEDKWCCTVCCYLENPTTSDVCVMCDSPNYEKLKDYQIKEQCKNCMFLNGQFAEECEMCGDPLSFHNVAKKGLLNTPKNRHRRDVY